MLSAAKRTWQDSRRESSNIPQVLHSQEEPNSGVKHMTAIKQTTDRPNEQRNTHKLNWQERQTKSAL